MTAHIDEHHNADEAPSVRRCFTSFELGRRRAVDSIPLTLARHLVAHLGHRCAECWRGMLALQDLEEKHDLAGLPLEPEGLAPSTDPVVLALRTVGGWPPRRWLRPGHRAVLDRALEPFGFLALVLEEARRLARRGEVAALTTWVDAVAALGDQGPVVAALRARALAYTAEALVAAGDTERALASIDLADQTVSERPAPDDLWTVLIVVRARVVEAQQLPLARAYLEMAVERLNRSARGELLAEVVVELVELLLRHQEHRRAEQVLTGARRVLSRTDQPLLAERLKLCQVKRWLLLAQSMAPGLKRLAAHGTALGHWAMLMGVPATVDAPTWHGAEELGRRLSEVAAEYTSNPLRQNLVTVRRAGVAVRLKNELRVLLAGALMATGEKAEAEVEVGRIEQAYVDEAGLMLSLEEPRRGLLALRRDFGHVAAVEQLVGPVVAMLDRLREPVVAPPEAEPADAAVVEPEPKSQPAVGKGAA